VTGRKIGAEVGGARAPLPHEEALMPLNDALVAVATSGATTIVQAAGTDAWKAVRAGVARLFGHGDPERTAAEVERLDGTRDALADGDDAAAVLSAQREFWRVRIEDLLRYAAPQEQERVAEELHALAQVLAPAGGAAAIATGKASARDGGRATSGVRRSAGATGPAVAARTGDAEAAGPGSEATSGIVST
jgi:hypothetical protein